MTSKGIAAVITVSCFVGNCLAILVRSLWKVVGNMPAVRIPWYGDKEYAKRKIYELNQLYKGTGFKAKLFSKMVGEGTLKCEEYVIIISKEKQLIEEEIEMLSVKYLSLIFMGRSRESVYRKIRELKYKYNLHYSQAELPIDVLIKEGISRETIMDLIKKADK